MNLDNALLFSYNRENEKLSSRLNCMLLKIAEPPMPIKAHIERILKIQETDASLRYSITLDGNADYAAKFEQRIRVELSKLRKMVKDRGLAPKYFKLFASIECVEAEKTILHLDKYFGKTQKLGDELTSIFLSATNGQLIK